MGTPPIHNVIDTLFNKWQLLEALNQLERSVFRQQLDADLTIILAYCHQHAPHCIGEVQAISEAILRFCEGRISSEETKNEHTRILRSIEALRERLTIS